MKNQTPLSRQLLGILILFSVAGLFFLCAANQSMVMRAMGQSSPCGTLHTTDLCPMTLGSRLSFWQSRIVHFSSSFDALALLMFLAAVAFFWNSAGVFASIRSGFKRTYNDGFSPHFDYLLAQFSQGILRPKIY